jgi:DNA-binding MarR family transcriptional regulator
MSELCGAEDGRSFGELKEACSLTDGNLSRHLQALEDAGVIKVKKSFVDSRPLTTVTASVKGKEKFLSYLSVLEEVLKDAATRVGVKVESRKPLIPTKLKATT